MSAAVQLRSTVTTIVRARVRGVGGKGDGRAGMINRWNQMEPSSSQAANVVGNDKNSHLTRPSHASQEYE